VWYILAEHRWCIFGEHAWYIFGEHPWCILGEHPWYIYVRLLTRGGVQAAYAAYSGRSTRLQRTAPQWSPVRLA